MFLDPQICTNIIQQPRKSVGGRNMLQASKVLKKMISNSLKMQFMFCCCFEWQINIIIKLGSIV